MKKFKSLIFALLAVVLMFTVVSVTTYAWSDWQNVHARLPIPGVSASRDARG